MQILRIDTWQAFREFVDRDRFLGPVHWRGQRDPGWPLASSFERVILGMFGGHRRDAPQIFPYGGRYQRAEGRFWNDEFYASARDSHLKKFQHFAQGARGPSPAALSLEEWWALGRHFGLVTPLLDWTQSPYIAAFFALSELAADLARAETVAYTGRQVAVYRLAHSEGLTDDALRVVEPAVQELGRMHGQRGLFTWLDSQDYFELQGFLDNTGRGDALTQVLLADGVLPDGLRDLRAHGIDHRLLFPDLTGAAMSANLLGFGGLSRIGVI